MKGTEHFKRTITEFLNQRAVEDPLFAPKLKKTNKNIDDCISYILTYVKNSGCTGFTDEEIYSQVIHYYDQDDIKVGNVSSCRVIVNHVVELTEEEKAEARKEAIKQYQEEEISKMRKRDKKIKKAAETTPKTQPTLFDF